MVVSQIYLRPELGLNLQLSEVINCRLVFKDNTPHINNAACIQGYICANYVTTTLKQVIFISKITCFNAGTAVLLPNKKQRKPALHWHSSSPILFQLIVSVLQLANHQPLSSHKFLNIVSVPHFFLIIPSIDFSLSKHDPHILELNDFFPV